MTLEEYMQEAHADLYFRVQDIAEYSISIGLKIQKWAKYLYHAEIERDRLENLMQEVYKTRFHYYTFEYEYQLEKKSIDVYVKGDSEYIEARKQYQDQDKLCKLIQSILSALEKQNWTIKSCIDMLNYNAGK